MRFEFKIDRKAAAAHVRDVMAARFLPAGFNHVAVVPYYDEFTITVEDDEAFNAGQAKDAKAKAVVAAQAGAQYAAPEPGQYAPEEAK
jgi:hypothetical protein